MPKPDTRPAVRTMNSPTSFARPGQPRTKRTPGSTSSPAWRPNSPSTSARRPRRPPCSTCPKKRTWPGCFGRTWRTPGGHGLREPCPAERLRREQSDFLQAANHEGEKADFHSLRHTTGAWLALAGNHPKVVQTVMRHSTITLTMDTYGHLFPGQDAEAVASLPDIMGDGIDAPDARGQRELTASGQSWGQMRGQYGLKSSQDVAGSCEPDKDSRNERRSTERVDFQRFKRQTTGICETWRK